MNVILLAALFLSLGVSCDKGKDSFTPPAELAGVVLNEVSGTPGDGDSWIEIYNTTGQTVSLNGVRVQLTDDYFVGKRIYTAPAGVSIGPGEYMVLSKNAGELDTDISPEQAIEVSLVAGDGTVLDNFVRDSDTGNAKGHPAGGSYSRLPDGTGKWYVTASATRAEENFGYTNRNGVWMWSTHWKNAPLATLAQKGIGHIILHEQAFKTYSKEEVMDRIAEAERLGMVVHIWFQCFYSDGKWISPVDDANQRYDQELFDEIIVRAEDYVGMGIKGIHLDYIRFGGTAHLHNHPNGVTGEGAITEFCRQISGRLKAVNKHVILSAALMWERQSAYYYGQNPVDMGKYMDILMPMIYRYAEGSGSDRTAAWAKGTADYFADNSGGAEVWAGLQTYRYVSGYAQGLSSEQLLSDCRDFTQTKAEGVVLFRFGLGDFPDMNGLWD